jgi:hypothetical protein
LPLVGTISTSTVIDRIAALRNAEMYHHTHTAEEAPQ